MKFWKPRQREVQPWPQPRIENEIANRAGARLVELAAQDSDEALQAAAQKALNQRLDSLEEDKRFEREGH